MNLSKIKEGSVATDALSEVLNIVRLRGERIYRCAPRPPVGIEMGATTRALHIVERGELVIRLAGQPDTTLVAGDLALLPHAREHTLLVGSPDRIRPLRKEDLNPCPPIRGECGGAGPACWLTGTLAFDDAPSAARLLATLPSVLVLRARPGDPREWLDVSRRLLLEEVIDPQAGGSVMVSRILDLLFIQTLRAWAMGPQAGSGWLNATMDTQIGAALTAIHREPDHRWTVESLARLTSLSRSAFADRFTRLVGQPPGAYLAARRLELAADLLRDGGASVGTIAHIAGYDSEAAFSRAFRRRYDASPVQWRTQLRSSLQNSVESAGLD